jgi:hypothetical protein
VVVYLGPPAQTPALLFRPVDRCFFVTVTSKWYACTTPTSSAAPHLRVVSRRESGKKLP